MLCEHPISELYTPDGLFTSSLLRCNQCHDDIEATHLERQLVQRINYLEGYIAAMQERLTKLENKS